MEERLQGKVQSLRSQGLTFAKEGFDVSFDNDMILLFVISLFYIFIVNLGGSRHRRCQINIFHNGYMKFIYKYTYILY